MKRFLRISLLVPLILSTVFTVSCMKKHEHTFEEWINDAGNDSVYCENRLFYRICTECSVLEWKSGSYDDHIFDTVKYAPTCTAKGYDGKTCTVCGLVERVNETDIIPHTWSSEYSFDNSFHWVECDTCDSINAKAEHALGEDGTCTVCDATEGIVYALDSTYYKVVSYTGTAKRVRIAEEYNGLPVKSIYEEAFKNRDNITSVIIPDSVTSIGESAFSGCSSLTSVTIPDSVTIIGDGAFKDCSSLTSVTIGNSVTSIVSQAFYNCKSLTSVTIPDSVMGIGERAFSGCSSLTSVTIGNSVTRIGDDAFSSCNSALYTEYNYGKYVGDSENPYAVLIEVTNKNLSTYEINPATKVIAFGLFLSCSRLSSITIPDGVRGIGGRAFQFCSSITSITIPDSVTSIGDNAFCGCKSLTSVTIPDSVTSIGYSVFRDCSSLTSVTIPDSVTSIGFYAFYDCDSLTSVTIPDSVTSIGYEAFRDCSSLTSIKYRGTEAEWRAISKGNNWNYNTGSYTITYNYDGE